jgi:5-methyltetrahydrofolate--homocysteine methyltransferase
MLFAQRLADSQLYSPLLFDGGMGTCIQQVALTIDDFEGQEGCNEILVASRPDVIKDIHAQYFTAGADIVETNSFGATSIVLAEYDIADRAYQLNHQAASLAKAVANNFSSPDWPRFVAGSIGPTTKLPTLGHISYWDLKQAYLSQIQGLVDGGVDLLLIETCQDLLQTKAALAAVNAVRRACGRVIPVAVQVTIETTGTMLVGTDMASVITALSPYDIDILGMNCATGPQEMASHIRTLAQDSPFLISCLPNAGIPENVGGHAHYHLSPDQLADHLARFVTDHGVALVGGCCGTTPAHIKAVRERLDELGETLPSPFKEKVSPQRRMRSLESDKLPHPSLTGHPLLKRRGEQEADNLQNPNTPLSLWERVPREGGERVVLPRERRERAVSSLTSLYSSTPLAITPGPVLVGERTNANGSKLFRDQLALNNFDALVDIAKAQVAGGAHILDVCTAFVSRNEVADMTDLIGRLNSQVDAPLMIDSTELPVIRESLALLAGKAIVNSINLEDGEERLNNVVALCREFGSAVVALTIDENGMAKTADSKLAIAQRIYDLVVHQHGMKPHDLVFDPLTFTLGSGDAEFRRAGIETLEGIRRIKAAMPGVSTILGISNISFGLKPAARHVINSVFLHQAVEAGLDLAIINPAHLLPLNRISPTERDLCLRLINDDHGDDPENPVDPLMALMAYYEDNQASSADKIATNTLPTGLEDRLQHRIVNGLKSGLEADLTEALASYSALAIINTILLEGMKTVGELFGRGEMQLPFVLQAAEVMKTAVAYLEPHMEKLADGQSNAKGSLVLATVKGDVHDIGKNLVDIILTNNGYTVYNLGIKQPIQAILEAAEAHQVDAIGMSGLLVKSTAIMKENLILMQERGLSVPVFLGGAALTKRFVDDDCQSVYGPPVRYCKDAFASLHFMDEVVSLQSMLPHPPLTRHPLLERRGEQEPVISPTMLPSPFKEKVSPQRRMRSSSASIPPPPFWGSKVVDDPVPLAELYGYINTQALFAGQWQVKRGSLTPPEYQRIITDTIQPVFTRLKAQALAEQLLCPKVVYGYFPCAADGDDLVVYHHDLPDQPPNPPLIERLRFSFPRGGKNNQCIADFFHSQAEVQATGKPDTLGVHLVTVGPKATDYAQQLYASGQYTEYLYFHGLAVETAEALAEYWHQRIRQELDIAHSDATDIKRLFAQGYQGSRYSFGYPACPNLEDQAKLFDLLDPQRIGVALSDEFMLEPEQSTSALIIHHPQAKYFDVRPVEAVASSLT